MPDTQLRFEAWTLPTSGDYKHIRDIDVALPGSSGVVELSNWTNGRLLVPAWWEHTDELVTDSSGCMILAFLGDTFLDEFKATRVTKPDKRPSQRALTGPQINGILEGLAIFPYNWPDQVEGALDWIWGGENALPDLSYAGLGNISATYSLYLSGERYELDVSLATTGDYLLNYNGNDTDPIDWDATHSDIKTAVEALPGITTVTVLQPDPDTREFFLVFDDPKDLSPDLTADFTGTGGLGNLTKMNDGFDTGADPTFTVDVDGDETEALDWDISANGLEGTATGGTGLQGLSTVSDVTVSGSGTAADPFIFAFVDPANPGSVTVTFSAGTAVLERTQAGVLDPGRITQSKPVDEGTGPEEVHGSYDDPPLEVVTDVTNGDSDYSIKVNVAGRYGGSQVVFDVTPGQTYQAKVPVRKTVAGLHTLVVHDIAQNPIAQTSPRDNLLAADGSFHDLEIVDVVIPPGTTQVMLREANTDPDASTWAPHYVDWEGAEFTEGQPPATATKIVRQLLEAAQDRGAFEFLDPDFTDTEDTAGNALDEINFTAFFGAGANLAQVLGNLNRSGYEWRVRRKDTPVGSLTHDLQMWGPGEGPDDKTTGGSGPSILAGSGTTGAEVVRRAAPYTALMAHGLGSLVKADTNATTLAAQGRIERILDAEHLSSDAALQEFLDAQFAEEEVNRLAATATIRADAQAVPLVDYGEGDKVWWQFPGLLDKEARRVRRIGWVHGATASFTVQGSKILTEEAAIRQALDRLLNEFRRRRGGKKVATQAPGGTSGSVGAHIHLQRTTTQSIDAAGTAISWESEWPFIGRENFAAVTGSQIVIQEPGYYNVEIEAYMAALVSSPEVWVTRTRNGSELRIWPPEDSEAWAPTHSSREFTPETAPAIPCAPGDVIQVYVGHGEGSAQDLDFASVAAYLVDRTIPESTGVDPYRDLILSQGPITYWRLGEAWTGSGTNAIPAQDETGNGHTALGYAIEQADALIVSPNGAAVWDQATGERVIYDGSQGAALVDFDVAEITVKAWVRSSSTSGIRMIVSRLNESIGSGRQWDLYCPSGSGVPRFRVDGFSSEVAASTNVCDGNVHHVVATYDGADLKIYVDGALEGTQADGSVDLTGNAEIRVGASRSTTGFESFNWGGEIDEVAIWGRALSLSEIQAQNTVGRSG